MCRAGGQRPVARELHVSPSAVNRQLRDLERALGVRLFERVGRQAMLTRDGEEVLLWADEVLRAAGDLADAAAGLREGARGTLRVAGSVTVGSYWLPLRLAPFLSKRRHVRLSLEQGPAFTLYEDLRRGRFDLVVAPGQDVPPGLVRRELGEARVVLVGSPPFRRGGPVDARWLARQPYVCAPAGTRGRTMFDALLAATGVAQRTVVAEAGHPEGVKALVRAGVGLAMAFRFTVASELQRGELVEIMAPPAWRTPLQAFTRAGHRPGPLLVALIEALAAGPPD